MADTGKAVLVVEDDREMRELVEVILEQAGYRVITAAEGQEALAKVQEELPGVILLDMKMPGMNGWQFAHAFRAQHDHAVPIVVLTAATDASSRAREIEAEGYLGKPFDLDDLLHTVERHLDNGT
jgi:DNA-binding response OmpR family regulator